MDKSGEQEQTERIMENLREYQQNAEEYSYEDFEEIFEDRDPFEFL